MELVYLNRMAYLVYLQTIVERIRIIITIWGGFIAVFSLDNDSKSGWYWTTNSPQVHRQYLDRRLKIRYFISISCFIWKDDADIAEQFYKLLGVPSLRNKVLDGYQGLINIPTTMSSLACAGPVQWLRHLPSRILVIWWPDQIIQQYFDEGSEFCPIKKVFTSSDGISKEFHVGRYWDEVIFT